MNESEMRRRELLRQTRKLYHDSSIPAVHPRYGRICQDLYGNEADNAVPYKGSFYTRLVIGIFCFICFVYMDQNNAGVAEVNSTYITDQIQKEFDPDALVNVWKAL